MKTAGVEVEEVMSNMFDWGEKKLVGLSLTEGGEALPAGTVLSPCEDVTYYAVWDDFGTLLEGYGADFNGAEAYDEIKFELFGTGADTSAMYDYTKNNYTEGDTSYMSVKSIPVETANGVIDAQFKLEQYLPAGTLKGVAVRMRVTGFPNEDYTVVTEERTDEEKASSLEVLKLYYKLKDLGLSESRSIHANRDWTTGLFDGNWMTIYFDLSSKEDIASTDLEYFRIDLPDEFPEGATVDFDYIHFYGDASKLPDSIPVTDVAINCTSCEIPVGKTVPLKAVITPNNASNKNVTWTSDNSDVATVDENGVVTGVSKGTAEIVVTTQDGGKTASCTINVVNAEPVDPETCEHKFDEWKTVVEPTCTEEGKKSRECPVCGKVEEESIDALGHEFGDWYQVKAPTLTEEGLEKRDCIRGDVSEEQVVAKLEYKGDMSVSDVTGKPGDTVKVFVSLTTDVEINTIGFNEITYDESILTFTGFSDYEALQEQCLTSSFDDENAEVVATLKESQMYDGVICALNFVINENAAEAAVEVSVVPDIKLDSEEIAVEVDAGAVSVTLQKVGDLNCDEYVDMNDAILLLQHSMFPSLYPLEYKGSVDFNKDEVIDMNDAILLLQHSMFPDLYPIA